MTRISSRFLATEELRRYTVGSYEHTIARLEDAVRAKLIKRRAAREMHSPRFFAHMKDAFAGVLRAGEVEVSHFCNCVADGVVDGTFADFATLDVGDGNAQSEGNGGRSEHFVAVGGEEDDVGAHFSQGVGQAEGRDADGFRHADVGVGTEQAFDGDVRSEVFPVKFLTGMTELWREMRAHADDAQIDLGMSGEVFQDPVEVTGVGAGGGDDGYFARLAAWLHACPTTILWAGEIDIPGSRV